MEGEKNEKWVFDKCDWFPRAHWILIRGKAASVIIDCALVAVYCGRK